MSEGAQSNESVVSLSQDSKEELLWWDNHMKNWNGKTLLRKEIDLTIPINGRLGSILPAPNYRVTVVGRGEANAYQLSGIAGSNTSNSNLHDEANWLVCAPESGQYHSSSLNKQPRRHGLQGASRDTMDLVSREEYPHNSTTSTWCAELHS